LCGAATQATFCAGGKKQYKSEKKIINSKNTPYLIILIP